MATYGIKYKKKVKKYKKIKLKVEKTTFLLKMLVLVFLIANFIV